jgi:Integrase core domain
MPDNGQVERMNRIIKDATVRRYYYDSHDRLRRHLDNFANAYNFGRRLKCLRGLTPQGFISGQRVQVNEFGGTLPIALRGAFPERNGGISEQDLTTVTGPDLRSASKSASDTVRHRGRLT